MAFIISTVIILLSNQPNPAAFRRCTGLPAFMRLIRYDTIQKFNVDSKAECDQLNLKLILFIYDAIIID